MVVLSGHDVGQSRGRTASRCCGRRTAVTRSSSRRRPDQRLRGRPAGGRADGPPRTTPAALRRLHAGPRPPRRLAHRKSGSSRAETSAKLLAEAAAGVRWRTPSWLRPTCPRSRSPRRSSAPPPDWAAWLARVTAVRERARPHLAAVSASGLEGTDPRPRRPTDGRRPSTRVLPRAPATSSSRHGRRAATARRSDAPSTACCRRVDLATGAGLDDAVAAQVLAEGVVEHAELVQALVRSALAPTSSDRGPSPLEGDVRRNRVSGSDAAALAKARGTRSTSDETVLEGFVDLSTAPTPDSSSSTTRPTRCRWPRSTPGSRSTGPRWRRTSVVSKRPPASRWRTPSWSSSHRAAPSNAPSPEAT